MPLLEAPPLQIDTMYHVTALDSFASIHSDKLQPNPDRWSNQRKMRVEEMIDAARPPQFVEAGIARRTSVFAHPYLERLKYLSVGAARITNAGRQPIVLAIETDPHTALVADAMYPAKIHTTLLEEECMGTSDETRRRLGLLARSYWENSMSLIAYRQFFGTDGIRTREAPDTLPPRFEEPEVLITGPIDPNLVEWVASLPVPKEYLLESA